MDLDPEAGHHPHHDQLELDRIATSRLQQQQTVGSTHPVEPQEKWLPMGAGKEYPPSLPDWEAFVVEFEGSDDPMHPHNWSIVKRYACCLALIKFRCKYVNKWYNTALYLRPFSRFRHLWQRTAVLFLPPRRRELHMLSDSARKLLR